MVLHNGGNQLIKLNMLNFHAASSSSMLCKKQLRNSGATVTVLFSHYEQCYHYCKSSATAVAVA